MSTPNGANQARGGRGDFRRKLEVADRDGKVAVMYCQGAAYSVIAAELGYSSKGDAQRAVMKVFAERASTRELRTALETRLLELDEARAEGWATVKHPPPMVSRTGAIVRDDDGNPVPDEQARMAALSVVLRANEITAKLQGLNAPKRVHTSVAATIASIPPGDLDRYIRERTMELADTTDPQQALAERRRGLQQLLSALDAEAERLAIPAIAEPA